MTDPLALFWVHTLSVRRFQSAASYGDTFAAATNVTGFYEDKTTYSGGQIIATGRFAFPIDVPYVPPQSEVVLPAVFGGRTVQVQFVEVGDAAGVTQLPAHQVIGVM